MPRHPSPHVNLFRARLAVPYDFRIPPFPNLRVAPAPHKEFFSCFTGGWPGPHASFHNLPQCNFFMTPTLHHPEFSYISSLGREFSSPSFFCIRQVHPTGRSSSSPVVAVQSKTPPSGLKALPSPTVERALGNLLGNRQLFFVTALLRPDSRWLLGRDHTANHSITVRITGPSAS